MAILVMESQVRESQLRPNHFKENFSIFSDEMMASFQKMGNFLIQYYVFDFELCILK